MKIGKSLAELATQIEAEEQQKRDFIAPTNLLTAEPDEQATVTLRFDIGGTERSVTPTRLCLSQVCERVGIPQKYADRMTGEHRELLALNLNHWFQRKPETRMLRTLINGTAIARAFLSERYRPLDNGALARAVLPHLFGAGCEVLSSEITEKRLYIQAATPKLEIDLAQLRKDRGAHARMNDIVRAGVVISNSEVGCGSLRVEPMLYRLVCTNGLILNESIKRYHVGRGNDAFAEMEAAAEYFTDETREMDDKAFWAKVVDVVKGVFDKGRFQSLAEKFAATGEVSLASPTDAVREVETRYKLTQDEGKSILDHLIAGGDPTLFGLVNAVTRSAEDSDSYDRAIELERLGGQIIELPPTLWSNN